MFQTSSKQILRSRTVRIAGRSHRARQLFPAPYWFLSSKEPSQAKGLPPILVFAAEVAKWSDGTAATMYQE